MIVVLGIGVMLWLNIKWNINAMLALLLGALFIGFAEMAGTGWGFLPPVDTPMSASGVLKTIQNGFGSTLGSLAIIVVFGAVIGKLMVDSGAASQIAETMSR